MAAPSAASVTAMASLRVSAAALAAVAMKPLAARDHSCIEHCDQIAAVISGGDVAGADKSIATSAVVEAVCAVATVGVSQVAVAALRRAVVTTVSVTGVTALPLHCVTKLIAAAKSEASKQRDLVALSSQLVVLAALLDCDPSIVKSVEMGNGGKADALNASWLPNPSKLKDASTRVACGAFLASLSACAPPAEPLPYDIAKCASRLWAAAAKEPVVREALVPVLLRLVRPRPWGAVIRPVAADGYTAPLITALVDEVFASPSCLVAGTAGAFVASALFACSPGDAGQLANLAKLALSAVLPAGDLSVEQTSLDLAAAVLAEGMLIHASNSVAAVTTSLGTVAAKLADLKAVKPTTVSQSTSAQLTQRLGVVRQGFRLWAAALGSDTIRCQAAEAALAAADGSSSPVAAWTYLSAGRSLLSFVDPPTENALLAAWGACLRAYNGAARQLPASVASATTPSAAAHEALLPAIDALQHEAVELLVLALSTSSLNVLLAKITETLRQGVGIELVSRALVLTARRIPQLHPSLCALARDVVHHGWQELDSPVERAILCAAAVAAVRQPSSPEFARAAFSVISALDFPQENTISRSTLTSLSSAAALALTTFAREPSHEVIAALSNTAILLLRWSVRSFSACNKAKTTPSHNLISSRRVGLLLWEAVLRCNARLGSVGTKHDEATIALMGSVLKESLLHGEIVTLRPPGTAAPDVTSIGESESSVRARYPFSPATSIIEALIACPSSRKRADTFPCSTADLSIMALAATFGTGDQSSRKKTLAIVFDILAELDAAAAGRKASKHAIITTVWMCLVAARKSGRQAKQTDLAVTLLQQLIANFLPSDTFLTRITTCAAISELPALAKIGDVEIITNLVNSNKASMTPDTIAAALAWITRVRGSGGTSEGCSFARQQFAQQLGQIDWPRATTSLAALAACASTLATQGLIHALGTALAASGLYATPAAQLSACAAALHGNAASPTATPSSPTTFPEAASAASAAAAAVPYAPLFVSGGAAFVVSSLCHSRSLSLVSWVQPGAAGQAGGAAPLDRGFAAEASRSLFNAAEMLTSSASARCPSCVRARLLNEAAPFIPYQALMGAVSRLPASATRHGVSAHLFLPPPHAPPHQVIAALQQIQQSRPDVLPLSAPDQTKDAASLAAESRAGRMDAAAEDGGAEGAQASAGLSAAVSRLGGGNRAFYFVEASVKGLILGRVATMLASGSFDVWPIKARTDLAACVAAAGSFLGSESGLGTDFASILVAVLAAWGQVATAEGFPLLEDLRVHLGTAVRTVIADVGVSSATAARLLDVACMSNIHSDDASIARGAKAVADALEAKQSLPLALLHRECCAAWEALARIGNHLATALPTAPSNSGQATYPKSRAAIAAVFSASKNKLLATFTAPEALGMLPDALLTLIAPWCLDATGPFRTLLSSKALRAAFDTGAQGDGSSGAASPTPLSKDVALLLVADSADALTASERAAQSLAQCQLYPVLLSNAVELLIAAAQRLDPNEPATVTPVLTLAAAISATAKPCITIDAATALLCAAVRLPQAAVVPFAAAVLAATPTAQLSMPGAAVDDLWQSSVALALFAASPAAAVVPSILAAPSALPTDQCVVALFALACSLTDAARATPHAACACVYLCLQRWLALETRTDGNAALDVVLAVVGKWVQDPRAASVLAVASTAAALDAPLSAPESTLSFCIKLTTKAYLVADGDEERAAALSLLPAVGARGVGLQRQAAGAFTSLVARDPMLVRQAVDRLPPSTRDQLKGLATVAQTPPQETPGAPRQGGAAQNQVDQAPAPLRLNLSAYR